MPGSELTKALGGYVLWDVGDMSFEKESKVCNLLDFFEASRL